MESMAEDQPTTGFPGSPRSPSCSCHVGNRTPTFHGSASTVRQFLNPSFPGLDLCHLSFSPINVSTSSGHHLACAISSATAFQSLRTTFSVPRDSTACATSLLCHNPPALALLTGVKAHLVRRLTLKLEALQTKVHRMARRAARGGLADERRRRDPHSYR